MSLWSTDYDIAKRWADYPLGDSPDGVRRWNHYAVGFFRDNFTLFAALSILYLPGVYFGRRFMVI
jgi:hypothetical protein